MRCCGVSFRSVAALNKAAVTFLNKNKAVRAHKELAGVPGPKTRHINIGSIQEGFKALFCRTTKIRFRYLLVGAI